VITSQQAQVNDNIIIVAVSTNFVCHYKDHQSNTLHTNEL